MNITLLLEVQCGAPKTISLQPNGQLWYTFIMASIAVSFAPETQIPKLSPQQTMVSWTPDWRCEKSTAATSATYFFFFGLARHRWSNRSPGTSSSPIQCSLISSTVSKRGAPSISQLQSTKDHLTSTQCTTQVHVHYANQCGAIRVREIHIKAPHSYTISVNFISITNSLHSSDVFHNKSEWATCA